MFKIILIVLLIIVVIWQHVIIKQQERHNQNMFNILNKSVINLDKIAQKNIKQQDVIAHQKMIIDTLVFNYNLTADKIEEKGNE